MAKVGLIGFSTLAEPLILTNSTVAHDDVVVVDAELELTDELLPPRREFDPNFGKSWRYNLRKRCCYNDSHGSRGRKPRKPRQDPLRVRTIH